MRKASELRSLDAGQLQAEEQRLRRTLFNLRNQASRSQLDHPHEIKETRRELAQVLTILRERALDIPRASATE
jgi:large subunit ribosomal protein L29